jgi:phosphoglycolate phosphatase-like HAD superfamily hydrolase
MTLLYPGVAEVLGSLRSAGHPMAIVTGKFHAGAVRALTHVACIEHFDVIIGADSAEFAKPRPEPVLLALRKLGAATDNALMIGDSPLQAEAQSPQHPTRSRPRISCRLRRIAARGSIAH